MRYGFRRPSFSKSFKGATTGAFKRRVKRSVNPLYGRKGMGYLHNPRKAIYNGVYHRTTMSTHPHTAPSRTRAYRHAYYMKRRYGYVPDRPTKTRHEPVMGRDYPDNYIKPSQKSKDYHKSVSEDDQPDTNPDLMASDDRMGPLGRYLWKAYGTQILLFLIVAGLGFMKTYFLANVIWYIYIFISGKTVENLRVEAHKGYGIVFITRIISVVWGALCALTFLSNL